MEPTAQLAYVAAVTTQVVTGQRELLDQLLAAVRADPATDVTSPAARAILDADVATRAGLAGLIAAELRGGLVEGLLRRLGRQTSKPPALRMLLARLLEAALPLDEDQLVAVLWCPAGQLPADALARQVEHFALLNGLPRVVRERLDTLQRSFTAAIDPTGSSLATLLALRQRLANAPEQLISPDEWGRPLLVWLRGLDEATVRPWAALLAHCANAADRPRPSATWSRQAQPLVEAIGAQRYAAQLDAWLAAAKPGPGYLAVRGEPGLTDHNQTLLKGLLWAAGGVGDPHLAHAIARFGERCFKKLPGIGPAAPRLGNACVHVLSVMPGGIGIAHLSALSGTVRYVSGRQRLDAALDTAAERTGQTREDLEELAVPDGGLDVTGARRVPLGDFTAELVVEGLSVALRWRTASGRPQVTVPKAVREAHPGELKALKREVRELEDLVAGQVTRLERLWLADRRLPLAALRERYLEHPLVGQLGRRLLWLVEDGDARHELLWHEGRLARPDGSPVEVPDDAEARLWHVLDAASLDALLVWRDHVDSAELRQPFAQVWREVYRADGVATEDRRFAGQLVRQRAMLDLCRLRGWRWAVQGNWNPGEAYPVLYLPRWGLTAVVEIEPVMHRNDNAFFTYVLVGGVQFFETTEGSRSTTALPLGQVPPLVFSEVLRDVDLFVGASTVANEASFQEDGLERRARAEWRAAAWGELSPTAATRGQVLSRVLPRTTLRDVARVDERWLVVKGPKQTFRVHLGTANVRRDGDDEPLPVVASREAREEAARTFLPFEGDSMLSTILAKAFLLGGGE